MSHEMGELPAGLAMALGQHPEAMTRFAALSEAEKQSLIASAHAVHSKREMQALVTGLENRMF